MKLWRHPACERSDYSRHESRGHRHAGDRQRTQPHRSICRCVKYHCAAYLLSRRIGSRSSRQKVLHEVRLDPAVIAVIVQESKERGWNLHFECPDMIYLKSGIDFPQGLMNLLKVSRYKYVDNFLTDLPEVPHKFILSLHDPQERNALAKELRETFDQHLAKITVVPSHPVLVEGLPSGMSKAVGVEWLANHFGIKRDEVMCVGDNDNDAEMLQWAGVGVAMSGSSPAALAAADWIAPSVHEEGAVVAMEKFWK